MVLRIHVDRSPEDLDSIDTERPPSAMAGLSSLVRNAYLALHGSEEGEEKTTPSPDPLASLRRRVIEGAVVMDQYRLFNVLGRGGMGTVFLARDTELDRQVAIKLWNSDEPGHQIALLREAGVLAKLSHPNIVTIHASGWHEGRVFFVMEYVGGSDCLRWREVFQPDWREALRVCVSAGEGLAAAHTVGVVHHDFKPLNLLVGDDGQVKIIDFGLASFAGQGCFFEGQSGSRQPGTPATMAPERLGGHRGDARSDQYSFAATMWWLFYDEFPYQGKTVEQLTAAIAMGGPLAIGERPLPGTPAQVRRVLEKGLAIEPAERYRDMYAFVSALKEAPDWAARQRRRALQVTAMAALVTLIVGLPVVMLVRQARYHKRKTIQQVMTAPEPTSQPDARAESVDGILVLIEGGELREAERQWREWYGRRYALALPAYEGSLKVGQAFLAKARELSPTARAQAFEAAIRADTVCDVAELDSPVGMPEAFVTNEARECVEEAQSLMTIFSP